MARKSRKPGAVQAETTTVAESSYNTALYIRLSVMDSGNDGAESIQNQEELLKQYIAKHPEFNLKSVFIDNGETGVDFIRPAWNDLMRECREGKINCIIVKDLSRLGRNYIEMGEYLEQIFPLLGVRLIAVNDNYDNLNLTVNELLVSGLKNLVNDIYAKDISYKTATALNMKQKLGEFIGTNAAYGYLKAAHDKNKIVINPDTAPIVRQIFEWKAEGVGNSDICRRLEAQDIPSPNKYLFMRGMLKNKKFAKNLWTPNTVVKIIRNPAYLGHMAQGKTGGALHEGNDRHEIKREDWIVVTNTHEPIISQELFDRANHVLDKRKERYDENKGKYACFEKSEYILKNLVFCADCGKPLFRQKRITKGGKGAVWVYKCRTYKELSKCSPISIRESELNNIVLDAVRSEIQRCTDISEFVTKLNNEPNHKLRLSYYDAEIAEAEKELHHLSSLRQAVYEDYISKLLTVSEYQFAMDKYNADTETQHERLNTTKSEKDDYIQRATPENKWIAAFARFNGHEELTVDMVQELIERIEIFDGDKVSIIFQHQDEYAAVSACWG